ncbi:hypothetical protein JN535_03560 [Cellulosimicrobium cellulans]|uniref:hypothetical protein n=1 Tax=Cellulosimicrobium cellulans TaxID=1710 RepID=UPI001965B215|nr:hypothetical protein [Cellulosimicrobium cellulans]MBN0039251.1 hypothetical protein [Cellulosimicrobium cellulans]
MTEHEPTRRSADPRTVAIAGLMTVAWYAVPDVVRPRWARALAKTAVGTAGVVLTLTSTAEGIEAREGVRALRDAAREAGATGADPDASPDRPADGAPGAAREDNTYVPDHDEATPAPPAVVVGGAVAGVALATTLIVVGEKWVYRRGERLRARGVRLPHTRVGLVLGALAVALAAAEPLLWNAEDR